MSRAGGLDVVGLFAAAGAQAYGEAVTQLAHALQCAALAQRAGTDDEMVVAALLHDIGHLVEGGGDRPERHHGTGGSALVRAFVPPRVAWLIEHHVMAKRYLCSVDARYLDRLSPASRRSYAAQGARLEPEDQLALEAHPWFADALRLRRWDDAAKAPDAACPPLAEYGSLLDRYFGPQGRSPGPDRPRPELPSR